jgi:hypothetical protein
VWLLELVIKLKRWYEVTERSDKVEEGCAWSEWEVCEADKIVGLFDDGSAIEQISQTVACEHIQSVGVVIAE